MNHKGSCSGVRDIRVWRGGASPGELSFSAPMRVSWRAGRFVATPGGASPDTLEPTFSRGSEDATADETAAEQLDGSGLWLVPGLVDAHVHAGWQAFDAGERARVNRSRTQALIAQGLSRTLASGFTSARDAGGLWHEAIRQIPQTARPRLQLAGELIDRDAAERAGGLAPAVAAVLERGARWVKLVATAGVASAAGAGLEPHFTATELRQTAQLAANAGAGVMVHAWGGPAIDYAIEAAGEAAGTGAAKFAPVSLEHGIFLTKSQAERAAQAGLTFVPTLRIYKLVQAMIAGGELPASLGPRVREAIRAHPNAVRIARDAGLAIALGTDYGTAAQHGSGRLELDALVAAGLTVSEALGAATRGGAALMAQVDPDQNPALAGRITPGAPADAVLFNRDPRAPGAFSDPGSIAAVMLAGRVVAPTAFERNPS